MSETDGDGAKLLFVAPSAYPLGGVQVWLDYVLTGLRDHGWETQLALVSGRFHDVSAYLAKHPFEPTVSVAAPSGTRQARVNALRSCLIAARPDVVIGVNIADVYMAAAQARAKGLPETRAVATLHGVQADFLADFAARRESIDAVIATNRLAQRLVEKCAGYDTSRALYAPYGVDRQKSPSRVAAAAKDDDVLRLAYVGRIENEQKRIRDLLLILAMAHRSGRAVELIVVGDGPDLQSMKREASALDIDEHIRFLGELRSEEVIAQVYSKYDALIITSNWETGPIVAWEAMRSGLPVVTSRYLGSGAERALIDGENCLMFEVGDIKGAIEKLGLLAREDVRTRITNGGRTLIEKRYTVSRSVEQWSAALSTVLRLPQRPLAKQQAVPPSGRLDRLFGARAGEAIRRLGNRKFTHAESGGEWPHAYSDGAMNAEAFSRMAQSLDQDATA